MKKFVNLFLFIFIFIVILSLNLLLTYVSTIIDISYFRGVAIVILIYYMLLINDVIKPFKFDNLIVNIKQSDYSKNILLVILSLLLIGISVEFVIDTKYIIITNIVIFAFIGFNVGQFSSIIKEKLDKIAQKREDIITHEDYRRISDYMQRNNYIMIGDIQTRDLYSIQIKFNVKHADSVVSFLQFIVGKPEFAHLISVIFDHIKIENDNIYIDNKLITNPSELGLFIIREISKYNEKNKNTINAIIDL